MPASWLQRQWWTPVPTAGARLLQPVAGLYGALARLHRRRTTPQELPVPVVVVGNLVVGGAGKTPTTIALVEGLRQRGWTPGVVSRGYGRRSHETLAVDARSRPDEAGDEPLLIARRTGAPMVVGAQRVLAARSLLRLAPQVDLVIADDGLQHWALARDAQIIVIDERGFGNGLLLPAGPLRERPSPTPPARSLVLYNADLASTQWPGALARRGLAGALPWRAWAAGERPRPEGLDHLRRQAVVAAAGTAVPERFFAMLRALGLEVQPCPLPDHHDWSQPPTLRAGQVLLVTEKDAVKITADSALATTTWVAPLDFEVPVSLFDDLATLLPPRPTRRS